LGELHTEVRKVCQQPEQASFSQQEIGDLTVTANQLNGFVSLRYSRSNIGNSTACFRGFNSKGRAF